eukprot:SAG31_NODE_964_length_10697_cov_6.821004_4_plen_295_part_00
MRTRRRRRQQAPIRPPQQRLQGSTKAAPACKLTSPSTASRPLSMIGPRASRLGNLPGPNTSRRKTASFTGERQLQLYGRQQQLRTVRFILARASPRTAVDKPREHQSLILWCWLILFCVLSGNGSHLTPVFNGIVDSIGNSVPERAFIDLLGSTSAPLARHANADACCVPINLNGANMSCSDFQISSANEGSLLSTCNQLKTCIDRLAPTYLTNETVLAFSDQTFKTASIGDTSGTINTISTIYSLITDAFDFINNVPFQNILARGTNGIKCLICTKLLLLHEMYFCKCLTELI